MSSLKLRVDKYIDSDGGQPPEVSARIYSIDPPTPAHGRKRTLRRELVPITEKGSAARTISIDPGRYLVEVALPSGELLRDTVDVPASGQAKLVLRASPSPHEWLSWQHLAGNIPTVAPARGASAPATAQASATKRKPVAKGPQRAGGPGVAEPVALLGLGDPLPALRGNGDVWQALRSVSGSPFNALKMLNSGIGPFPVPKTLHDSAGVVYRVVKGIPGSRTAFPLPPTASRDFLGVVRSNSLELISLPTPWRVPLQGRDAVVEVAIQQAPAANDFASSVTVRDQQLAVVLGFLSNGALGAAMGQIESALGLLLGKVENPFAAAAGGYTLVGMMSDSKTQPWHQWIANLCQWFPQLPDGSILLAQLHLKMRRKSNDLKTATTLFKQAYNRGLPFYTMGVRWLLDGLETVGVHDTEAAEMYRQVRDVARRTHPMSPFTIMRIEAR